MRTIQEYTANRLEWRQLESAPRRFELVDNSDVYAELRWQKRSGSLAVGKVAEAEWSFKRVGFLQPRVSARSAQTKAELAVYTPGVGDGLLALADGQSFLLARRGFWSPEWVFRGSGGEALLSFTLKQTLTRLGCQVELGETARQLENLPLLLVIGWYLIVLAHDDAVLAAMTPVFAGAG